MGVIAGRQLTLTPTFQNYNRFILLYMYIIASTPYFEDVNTVGVIPAPNLTPIFQNTN